jgi:REP element-mobilizing transposase RayT
MQAPFGDSILAGIPLAYLITFRTYGTWLPGDARGTVDDTHNEFDTPMMPAIPGREREARRLMVAPPMILNMQQRVRVESAIRGVCTFRTWKMWEIAVQTNHVHVVVSAPSKPDPILISFKSWATRALNDAKLISRGHVWARGGSKRYLWDQTSLDGAIRYVRDMQNLPNHPCQTKPRP